MEGAAGGGAAGATTEAAQGDEAVSPKASVSPDVGVLSAEAVATDQPTTATTSSIDPARSSGTVDSKEEYRDQGPSTGQWHREYRFVYARAGDLTIRDVGHLLIEYKELVLKYVALSKAVEASRPLDSVGTQTSDAHLGWGS